ncbi:MAG: HAD family hydrolase [Bacteroidales bacterium]|nr:HAD family hydrolase [Bacteroidales bacterium]
MEGIRVIGFDADDTLWVNEPYYRDAEEQFVQLVASYGVNGNIAGALFETEISNLSLYGYGIKAFMLSLVECSIQLTDGAVSSGDINRIIGIGKSMLERPIELLDDIKLVLKRLAPHYRLIVATKGDLLDQERKMRRSGIADYFHHIEVMSDKKEQQYVQLLKHLDIAPEDFLMIGNSLKSDIIPPLKLGAWGVYVPYHTTWAHEEVDKEPESKRFFKVEQLHQVLDLIPVSQ